MDLNKLSLGDKVIAGSGLALLVFSFLPWFKVSVFGFSDTANGWEFFWTGILPVLLGLVLVAYVALTKLADGVELPELPVPYNLVVLGVAALAALLIILRLLMGVDDGGTGMVDRSFGLFLSTLAAIGLAVGAFLNFQAEGGQLPTGGGNKGGGNQPPTPF